MKAEEDVHRERSKILLSEEKIQSMNKELLDSQKRISQFVEKTKKTNHTINNLKNQIVERHSQCNTEIANMKNDIKTKIELLRLKDDIIKSSG